MPVTLLVAAAIAVLLGAMLARQPTSRERAGAVGHVEADVASWARAISRAMARPSPAPLAPRLGAAEEGLLGARRNEPLELHAG